MKVNELMLGDWIEDGYKKAQVTSITCDGIVETTAAISNIEVVDPIPLTEEILVKNGFDKDERSKYFHLYTLDMEGHWDFDISWSSQNGFSYEDIKLTYVHQLQHLLRLCGIEKEITL